MKARLIKLILKCAISSFNDPAIIELTAEAASDGCPGSDLLRALAVVGPYRSQTITFIGIVPSERKTLTQTDRLSVEDLSYYCKKAAFIIKANVLCGNNRKAFHAWYITYEPFLGMQPSDYVKAGPDFDKLEELLLRMD